MTDIQNKYEGENLTKVRACDVDSYDECTWLVERLDEIIIGMHDGIEFERIHGDSDDKELRDWMRRANYSSKMTKKNIRGIAGRPSEAQRRRS